MTKEEIDKYVEHVVEISRKYKNKKNVDRTLDTVISCLADTAEGERDKAE